LSLSSVLVSLWSTGSLDSLADFSTSSSSLPSDSSSDSTFSPCSCASLASSSVTFSGSLPGSSVVSATCSSVASTVFFSSSSTDFVTASGSFNLSYSSKIFCISLLIECILLTYSSFCLFISLTASSASLRDKPLASCNVRTDSSYPILLDLFKSSTTPVHTSLNVLKSLILVTYAKFVMLDAISSFLKAPASSWVSGEVP